MAEIMATAPDETVFARALSDSLTWVGTNPDDGSPVTLTDNDLLQTCYIEGNVSDQQTALCHRLCVQWAHADRGFCYISPHCGPSLDLLYALPADCLEDVVWIDIARPDLCARLDVPEAEHVCVDPLDGPEDAIDRTALTRDPITGRIADLLDVFSEHETFDWNVATVWSLLLPGVLSDNERSVYGENDVLSCFVAADLEEDVDPLLELIPGVDRPTVRTHLQRAVEHDPRMFQTARALLGVPTDGLQYYNPLTRDTTYSFAEGVTDNAIILVSGDTPDADNCLDTDIARSATHLLTMTIVRRLWEALQTMSESSADSNENQTHKPGDEDLYYYPLVLDGISELLLGAGTLFRELLTNCSRTPLAFVVSGPSPSQFSDTVAIDIRDHVRTMITFEADAPDAITRSLLSPGIAPIERSKATEAKSTIGEAPVCWVETDRSGTPVGCPPQSSKVPAVPFRPVARHRRDSKIEAALTRSLERSGVDLSWPDESVDGDG